MQLSDAIVLGDSLKKGDPERWLSQDGSCGCAFGGAMLAAGVTSEEFHRQAANYRLDEIPAIKSRWPWITLEHLYEISRLYREAAYGLNTIEDVAAYVRYVEPAEQSSTNVLDAAETVEVA